MKSVKFLSTFLGLIFTLMLSACSKNQSSFSELPGFEEYFAKNKPSESIPSNTDQALLTQFRPRIFIAKGQTQGIDFYSDYIANGSLYVDGKFVSDKVTQALLNQYKDNVKAEFRHKPSKQQGSPSVYARLHKDELVYKEQRLPLTFLSYNLVFAHSGLVKGLATWKRLAMGIIGDNTDWHQLDHYVGLTITLLDQQPIAVTLQQHNYQTTWLLTKSDNQSKYTLKMPIDQRIAVDVAMQSNELFLHSTQLKKYPGISFIKADNIEFYLTGKNKPMMAGWDITHGEIEQKYRLKFIPAADAFYTFKGKLGESRILPGRDGPPGADYVTLPALMPFANRLVSSYRPRNLATEKKKIKDLFDSESFTIKHEGLLAYKRDFMEDLWKLKQ